MSLNLEQTITTVIQQLANFFGTTAEVISENAPIWLSKYGWYYTLSHLGGDIFVGVLLGLMLNTVIGFIIFGFLGLKITKGTITILTLIFLITFIVVVAIPLITCAVAPEYVGLNALLNLLKNN